MDAVFGAVLRGEAAPWPAALRDTAEVGRAERRLLYHGIGGLLHERRGAIADWPTRLLDTIRDETLARSMWEIRHRLLMAGVFESLHAKDVGSAVMKGTALAYGQYPSPALRFRGDTDLLIGECDLARTRQVLLQEGWIHTGFAQAPFGEVRYQELWSFSDTAGFTHHIDLHWEVTNSRALRPVLDVEQLLANAVPLTALSVHARGPDPVTALLNGAINRAAHAQCGYEFMGGNEFDPDRLIWAYDFHLLAASLSHAQWQEFTRRCIDTGVASIGKDALDFAASSIHTDVPEWVYSALAAAPQESRATRYIKSAVGPKRAWADLQATPGIKRKFAFALARAFPSPDHIRMKYQGFEHWPTALLYLRRLVRTGLSLDRRWGI